MPYSPTEKKIWKNLKTRKKVKKDDAEINARYESQERRVVTETHREKLPNFVDSLKRPGHIDLRPFYQRRERWNEEKKSKLIESFIVNVPVPPIIMYEQEYGSYEVMDGQQRVTAIKSFYDNEFKLSKLDLWPELNGRTYSTLPAKIKAGIDRRSISSIIILHESAGDPEEAMLLKQQTFERLNTGGVKLDSQEVRNCIYQGKFNELLLELSNNSIFRRVWNIPDVNYKESTKVPRELTENKLFKNMEDVELILRFFALRHIEHFRRGLKGFLDLYMAQSRSFSEEDVQFLEDLFVETINLAFEVYGEKLFRPFDVKEGDWKDEPYKAFYDSIMVAFSKHLSKSDLLIKKKNEIIKATKAVFVNDSKKLLVGGGKGSKTDIQARLKLIDDMLTEVIG